jgi:hypothetical protein
MARKRKHTSPASSAQENGPELSGASSPAPTPEPLPANKKSKFERRFGADSTSDEGILGMHNVSKPFHCLY